MNHFSCRTILGNIHIPVDNQSLFHCQTQKLVLMNSSFHNTYCSKAALQKKNSALVSLSEGDRNKESSQYNV